MTKKTAQKDNRKFLVVTIDNDTWKSFDRQVRYLNGVFGGDTSTEAHARSLFVETINKQFIK